MYLSGETIISTGWGIFRTRIFFVPTEVRLTGRNLREVGIALNGVLDVVDCGTLVGTCNTKGAGACNGGVCDTKDAAVCNGGVCDTKGVGNAGGTGNVEAENVGVCNVEAENMGVCNVGVRNMGVCDTKGEVDGVIFENGGKTEEVGVLENGDGTISVGGVFPTEKIPDLDGSIMTNQDFQLLLFPFKK